MNRRHILKSIMGGAPLAFAGCGTTVEGENGSETPTRPSGGNSSETPTGPSGGSSTTSRPTPMQARTATPEEPVTSESAAGNFDVRIDYTVHEQSTGGGEFEIPDPYAEDWSWIIVDFEVLEGELDMEDVWFAGLFETEERYRTVSRQTSEVRGGIESRGSIQSGGRGVLLHSYPRSPRSGTVGPNFGMTDQSIGGENVGTDGPAELYPPVSVEYSVMKSETPAILAAERARRKDADEAWVAVSLRVTEGTLNMEDVWFRSRLRTSNRVYEVNHSSSFADRGIRSRGYVKRGSDAHVLYTIDENESIESWGYEDARQDVSVSRV